MKITRTCLDIVETHARHGYPHEVCGVLVGADGHVTGVHPVENRERRTPRARYEIAPADLRRIQDDARRHGHDIVGYYHSHPDHPAQPSETDRERAGEGQSDGLLHLVVGVDPARSTESAGWVFRETTRAFEREPLEIEPEKR